MNAAPSSDPIDVHAVRVGMFVHLDVGWMAHPFPLSSFKISAEQLAKLHELGIKQLRWSPQLSDPPPAPAGDDVAASPHPTEAGEDRPVDDTAAAFVDTADRSEHRRRLAEQRAALSLAEGQFAEAARDCRRLTDLVAAKPHEARARAEALSTALLEKMLASDDVCIRLLTHAAGDKASVHAMNVAVLSLLMARSAGLPDGDLHDVGVGAMLHDVGKLELPDRVRHLQEHFSAAEIRLHEDHVQQGVAQARRMGLSAGATLVVAQHHEHADGSGYPLHVNAERMSDASSIVSLVNRYDNLCNPQLPAQALTPHESLSLLFAQGKHKFGTQLLGAFIKLMGVYPPGSTVQLTDDRHALVVAVNASRPLKPRVLVHEPRVPRADALVLDLETVPGLGIRRSLKPQQLPEAAHDYLSPRPRVAYFFEPTPKAPPASGTRVIEPRH